MKRFRFAQSITLFVTAIVALLLFSSVALAQTEPEGAEANPEPGVLIVTVDPESPAVEAGLQRGDIVLRVDDLDVNDALALRQAIGDLAPGDKVVLTVLHGDDERELTVTLGERNDGAFLGVLPYASQNVNRAVRIVRPDLRSDETSVLPESMPLMLHRGVVTDSAQITITLVIVDVVEDSPAATAELKAEDRITAINGEPLVDPQALVAAVRDLSPGDELTLTIQRDVAGEAGEENTVTITLGQHPDESDTAYLGVRFAPRIEIEEVDHSMMPPMRGFQQDGSQERFYRRFQFRLPRFLPQLHERIEEWRDDQQGECQCGPKMQRRWYFMPGGDRQEFHHEWRDERDFTIPLPNGERPNGYFWFEEAPVQEEVIIIHKGADGDFTMVPNLHEETDVHIGSEMGGNEMGQGREFNEDVEEYEFLPDGQSPSAPTIEISEELI